MRFPTIIDKYIIKKFIGTFVFSISLLVIIVIVFDVSEKIDDFIEKDAPLSAIVFDYYFNFIPYFVNLFSYLFTFIAVIFFTSKLAYRTEIIAILNGGVSFRRLLVPYIVSAILIGVSSFVLNNFIIPHTNISLREFEKKYIHNKQINRNVNIHMQISPGVFIYVERYDNTNGVGTRFTLEEFDNHVLKRRVQSDGIKWNEEGQSWMIKRFQERKFAGKKESVRVRKVLDTVMNFTPADFMVNKDDMKTMDWFQLKRFIQKEKLKGANSIRGYEIEQQKRIAFPFSSIILTLIGVSLSCRKVRGGIGMHIGIGIAIAFLYILLMQISDIFGLQGGLNPILAVWIPNILFSVVAAYLLSTAPK